METLDFRWVELGVFCLFLVLLVFLDDWAFTWTENYFKRRNERKEKEKEESKNA